MISRAAKQVSIGWVQVGQFPLRTFNFLVERQLRPAELPFAVRYTNVSYADETDIVSDERMAASLSWPTL